MGKVQVQLGQLETFHSRWGEGPHDNMYRMVSHTTDETWEIAVFPALVYFAEVCLSMPVSNAWQEHGCSGLEQVKIRLRTQLSPEMLQTCLAVTINGSEVGTPECCYGSLGESEEMKETSKRQLPTFQLQAKRMQGKPLLSQILLLMQK